MNRESLIDHAIFYCATILPEISNFIDWEMVAENNLIHSIFTEEGTEIVFKMNDIKGQQINSNNYLDNSQNYFK